MPTPVERLEHRLLDGPPRWTRGDLVDAVGIGLPELRALWRSLGFAAVDDAERSFTDADVRALRDVGALAEVAQLDAAALASMTRMLGQAFSRLASWQSQLVVDVVGRAPELVADGDGAGLEELIATVLPLVSRLQDYVWRRQLAATLARAAAAGTADAGAAGPAGAVGAVASEPATGASTGASTGVGFADLTAFTSLTRRSGQAQLVALIERFEATANDVVGSHGGRVVKTIGDGVLFEAGADTALAAIALDLLAAWAALDDVPELSVGLAWGEVLHRYGDVFGQPVNIASRLTSLARPGTVLVDRLLAERLRDDPRYALRPLRSESVRGYGHLRPWRLRRTSADPAAGAPVGSQVP